MSKVLKTAAIVVGAVALVATGVGAIGAAVAGTSISAGIAGAGVAGISVGTLGFVASALSLGATLTAKKPTQDATGSQTTFDANPDTGIPLCIGRIGALATLAFATGASP